MGVSGPPHVETSGAGQSPIFEMPGHLLRRCWQIAVAVFLDECEAFDLTPLQYVALVSLSRYGPLDQVGLGGVAALDRTTVSVVTKNLEERKLVERTVSPHDKRSKPFAITKAGEEFLEAVRSHVETVQERITHPLTPEELQTFIRLLKKIADENNELSRAPQRVPRSIK